MDALCDLEIMSLRLPARLEANNLERSFAILCVRQRLIGL
jgi:hypothetical protein